MLEIIENIIMYGGIALVVLLFIIPLPLNNDDHR